MANPLKFKVELEGKINTELDALEKRLTTMKDKFSIHLGVEGLDKLQSAVSNLNGDGLKSLTEGMAAFRKELANNKMTDFAGQANFEGAIAGLKKLETEYQRFMHDWQNRDGHSASTPINAQALASQMREALATAQNSMRQAWMHAMELSPEAASRLQSSLRTALGNLGNLVNQQISSGLLSKNTGFVQVFKEIETQIGQIGNMGKDFGPMQGYITNTTEIAGLLATAFQSVENQLQKVKAELASDNFQKLANSAEAAAESVNKLTTSFGPLLAKLGENQELKNFMTGLGEVVNSIRALTKNSNALPSTASGPKMSIDQMIKNFQINTQKIDVAYQKIADAQQRIKNTETLGKQLGLKDGDAEIQKLQGFAQKLEEIKQKLDGLRLNAGAMSKSGATSAILGPEYTYTLQGITKAETAMRKMAAGTTVAAGKVQQLTREEQQLAQAIQNATNGAQRQNQVLGDLKSMAVQYLSVYGMSNFGKEMAQITGELELQKTSLEVILNNASKASELYGQIRDLSQMSPFSFMDLMKSTRQLSAFGIETKDLYGTMKSLSDIGAGLNVDVNRLILAYGHTRSYGYLSGIQNRQFENAGIDMIGGLVKQYNELAKAEEEAGRKADYVTRKDIFSRMRNKSIDFKDVEKVIFSLDEPGGKFYNMQEKQFDTLGGKLRNLENNYNIMMSELGQKHRGLLMGFVSAITEVHEHWYRYERIIYGVVAALGVMKTAQLAVGRAALATNQQLAATALVNKQISQSTMYLQNYNRWKNAAGATMGRVGQALSNNTFFLRASEKKAIASNDDVRTIARNKEINNLTKQRIALTGNLTKAQRAYLLQMSGINASQARAIARMSSMRRSLLSIRLGFLQAATSARMFMVSLLTNPVTWIMALAGSVTWLVQKFGETKEQAKAIGDAIHDAAQKDIAGINDALQPYNNLFSESISGGYKAGGKEAIRLNVGIDENAIKGRVQDVFDDLQKALQSQAPLYTMSLFDIYKMQGEAKQVEALIQKLRDIQYVREVQDMLSDSFTDSINETGGLKDFGTEGLITNINDFSNKITDSITTLRQLIQDNWANLSDVERKAIEKYADDNHLNIEQAVMRMIGRNELQGVRISKLLQNKASSFGTFDKNVYYTDMVGDMKPVADNMAQEFINAYKDNGPMMKEAFQSHMVQIFAQTKVSDTVKPYITEAFAESTYESLQNLNKEQAQVFLSNYYESLVAEAIQEYMKGKINSNTMPDDVARIINEAQEAGVRQVENGTPKIAEAFGKMGQAAMDAFNENISQFATSLAQQLNASEAWKVDMKNKSSYLQTAINSSSSWVEFWEKEKKEFKSGVEKLQLYAKKAKIDLKVDIGVSYNSKKLKTMLDAVRKQMDKIPFGPTDPSLGAKRDALKALEDTLEGQYEIAKLAESEHVDLYDEKKKNGYGSNKDPMRELWQNRLKYIKEAYDAYKQWKKEVGDEDTNGEDPAMKIVENKFGKYLREAFGKNFDMKNIKDYQKFLRQMMADLEKVKFKDKETRPMFQSQLEGQLSQTQLAVLQENASELSSRFQKDMDDIIDKYEMFRNVLSATGSTDIASQVLGFDYQWKNKVDLIKDMVDQVLQEAGITANLGITGATDDKTIDKIVKTHIASVDEKGTPIEENIEKIKSVVDVLKKWRDMQKDLTKEAVDAYADMAKSLSDYASQVARINGEYEQQMAIAKNLPEAQRQQMERGAAAERDRKLFELSPAYKNLMNNPLTTSKQAGLDAVAQAKDVYNELWRTGGMSADEYTKKMQELNEALRAIDTKAVDEWVLFLEGGMKAVREQRIAEDKEVVSKTNAEIEKVRAELDNATKNGDQIGISTARIKLGMLTAQRDNAQKDADQNQNTNDEQEKFNRQVQAIVKGLQDFMSALNLVNSTLDSLGLGNTVVGKTLGNAADVGNSMLSGASALSSLVPGPYGMMAGAALGMIGGIAQVHDKNLQARIEDLQQDVKRIENYTQTIQRARERNLGYGSGRAMARYQDLWNGNGFGNASRSLDAAARAMRQYYQNASQGVNSYREEYDLLVQKRDNYIKMYDAEDAKKKKSEDQLEEYKAKIAELDDQMAYFTEDLAKDLWGLDVKSWSDQLGDALMTAWENGTSAAQAYEEATRDIMQNVIKQMMNLGILQPMMEKLREQLFGKDGKGGIFDINDINGSMPKVMDALAQYFGDGGDGQKYIQAATEFLNGSEQVLNQYGMTGKNNSSSSTLSSGVSGMSEGTADLLAGYINALRQDVSVMRILQTNFITQYWQDYVSQATSAYQSVANIEQDVAAMRRVQEEMADTLENFYSRFRSVTTGAERIYVQ